jgi:hypothetical protein
VGVAVGLIESSRKATHDLEVRALLGLVHNIAALTS